MRTAEVQRDTKETRFASGSILTHGWRNLHGIPFLEHMLDQVGARHGGPGHRSQGRLHIDAHHTVEDIGITIARRLQGYRDKSASDAMACLSALDEAMSRVVIDFSGAPGSPTKSSSRAR